MTWRWASFKENRANSEMLHSNVWRCRCFKPWSDFACASTVDKTLKRCRKTCTVWTRDRQKRKIPLCWTPGARRFSAMHSAHAVRSRVLYATSNVLKNAVIAKTSLVGPGGKACSHRSGNMLAGTKLSFVEMGNLRLSFSIASYKYRCIFQKARDAVLIALPEIGFGVVCLQAKPWRLPATVCAASNHR